MYDYWVVVHLPFFTEIYYNFCFTKFVKGQSNRIIVLPEVILPEIDLTEYNPFFSLLENRSSTIN